MEKRMEGKSRILKCDGLWERISSTSHMKRRDEIYFSRILPVDFGST
jgi:hypothetical protein